MNRAERRMFKKKMSKKLQLIADEITEFHNQYEGKDDKKLEELIESRIKGLDFNELMLLTAYLENSIGTK